MHMLLFSNILRLNFLSTNFSRDGALCVIFCIGGCETIQCAHGRIHTVLITLLGITLRVFSRCQRYFNFLILAQSAFMLIILDQRCYRYPVVCTIPSPIFAVETSAIVCSEEVTPSPWLSRSPYSRSYIQSSKQRHHTPP